MEGHGPLTDPLSSQQQHRRKTGGSIWKRMAAAGALACLLAGVLTGCGGVVPRAKADEDRPPSPWAATPILPSAMWT